MSVIRLDTAQFPYLFQEEGAAITSLIQVSRTNPTSFGDIELFHFVNGTISTRQNYNGEGEATVELRHSFARDEESDIATIAQLTLKSFQFANADRGHFCFSGWLTDALFYPPETVENPFTGIVKHQGRDADAKNSGFPYIPPRVLIQSNPLPFQVKVELFLSSQYELDSWVARLAGKETD